MRSLRFEPLERRTVLSASLPLPQMEITSEIAGGSAEVVEDRLLISGTEEADCVELVISDESIYVLLNEVEDVFDPTGINTIVINGGGDPQNDGVLVQYLAESHETITLFPMEGTITNQEIAVEITGFATITVDAGPGDDAAFLRGAASDNMYIASAETASLETSKDDIFCVNQVVDCAQTHGYAGDGVNNIAILMGNEARNNKVKVEGEGDLTLDRWAGGIVRAKWFNEIYVQLPDGPKNVVVVNPSDNDTSMTVTQGALEYLDPDKSVSIEGIFNSALFNKSRGANVATFVGSEQVDTVRARPHKVMMWGGTVDDPSYEITVRGAEVHLIGTAEDVAKLHDVALADDFLLAEGDCAALFREDGGLLYDAQGFGIVQAYNFDSPEDATNTYTHVDELLFDMRYVGDWYPI